ncbi:ATP-binding cassette A1 [Striga asiatica]|uniref:ATP-binding cassette A1 n=1 Tax=Striga asiatica TaxID=4170 RepID=A0A5A7PY67_STRAF|nr:ATP-binding cassette A1 [Striga asiatica]
MTWQSGSVGGPARKPDLAHRYWIPQEGVAGNDVHEDQPAVAGAEYALAMHDGDFSGFAPAVNETVQGLSVEMGAVQECVKLPVVQVQVQECQGCRPNSITTHSVSHNEKASTRLCSSPPSLYRIRSTYSFSRGAAKAAPQIVDEDGPLIHTLELHTLHSAAGGNLHPEDLKLHAVLQIFASHQLHDEQESPVSRRLDEVAVVRLHVLSPCIWDFYGSTQLVQ